MRVVLTRPEPENAALAERLRLDGFETVVCPLIATESLGDDPVDLEPYEWVVVTSANGARELSRRGRGRPRKVAAVGAATASALRAVGFAVDLVPERSTQEGLLAELPENPGPILLAAAEGARGLFVERTGADFVPLYRTHELRPNRVPDAELAVVASGSAARALAAIRRDIPVVSIGPVTSEVAREAGLVVAAEAESQDTEGIAAAVVRAAAR